MKNPLLTLKIHSLIRSLHREGNIEQQINSLSKIGEPAIPYLIKALGDSGRLGENAVRIFLAMGEPALPHLADALKDEKPEIRYNVIRALVKMGIPAIPHLIHASCRGPSIGARADAADALVGMGEAALPQLLASLEDSWLAREILPGRVLKDIEPSSPNSLRLLGNSIRFLKREQLKKRADQADVDSLMEVYSNWVSQLERKAEVEHRTLQRPPARFRNPISRRARNNSAGQMRAAIGGVRA
jgi:HEAT repeat protein